MYQSSDMNQKLNHNQMTTSMFYFFWSLASGCFRFHFFNGSPLFACLLVIVSLFVPTSVIAQYTYTIEGKKVELSFSGFDGTNVVFADVNKKPVSVPLTRLSPDELKLLLTEIIEVVDVADINDQLKAEDERTWRYTFRTVQGGTSGRTIRGKFSGLGNNCIYVDHDLGNVRIDGADLQRSDLLYVVRRLQPFTEKAKPAFMGDGEEKEKPGEEPKAKGNVAIKAPTNHAFVTAAIDSKRSQFLTVGGRSVYWWNLTDGTQLKGADFAADGQFWSCSRTGKYVVESYGVKRPNGKTGTRYAVWDTQTQKKIFAPDHEVPGGIVFSPDENLIAYQANADGQDSDHTKSIPRELFLLNLKTDKTIVLASSDKKETNFKCRFSPDSQWIAACGSKVKCYIWSTDSGKEQSLTTSSWRSSIDFSHDSQKLLVSGGDKHQVFDITTGEKIAQLNTPGVPVVFTTFGAKGMYIGGYNIKGRFYLWNCKTNQMHSWQAHDSSISMAFSNDGKTLVTTDLGAPVKIWDLETKTQTGSFNVSVNKRHSVRIHEDSNCILCFDGQNLEVRKLDEIKRDYEIAKAEIGGGVGKKEGLNPEWSSVLACLPDETNGILVVKPRDILSGKDLAKHIEKFGIKKMAEMLGDELYKSIGEIISIPGPEHQQLVGSFVLSDGDSTDKPPILFVQSNLPIDSEQLFKKEFGDSGVRRREFRGRKYVVGKSKTTAAFMPNSKTVFFAQDEAQIQALIKQLEQPPSDFARRVNQVLAGPQVLLLANGDAAAQVLNQHPYMKLRSTPTELVLMANLTDQLKARLNIEFIDKEAAEKQLPELKGLWQLYQASFPKVDPHDLEEFGIEQTFYPIIHNSKIKSEGSTVVVELDTTKVTNLTERFFGPVKER